MLISNHLADLSLRKFAIAAVTAKAEFRPVA